MGSFSEGESMASVSAPTKGSSSVEVQGPRVLNLFPPPWLEGGRDGAVEEETMSGRLVVVVGLELWMCHGQPPAGFDLTLPGRK